MFNYDAVKEHHSAYKYCYIILNPEDKTLYSYATSIEGVTLPDVFFKRHRIIYVPPTGYECDSLIAWLKEKEFIIRDMLECYKGKYFDGQNYHGKWDIDKFYSHCYTLHNQNKEEIFVHWKPENWYLDCLEGAQDDARKIMHNPDYLNELVISAKEVGVILNPDELYGYLRMIYREWNYSQEER